MLHNVVVDLEQGSSAASVSMVGRDAELRDLTDVLDSAASRSPRLMAVRGEAGVGKTTLVRAAADRARGLGFEVLWGSGLRLAADNAPYVSLAVAFQRRLAEPDGGASLRDAVAHVPGAGWLMPEPAGVVATPATGSAGSPIAAAGAVLFRLSASSPVLLVVDDVQWADTATRDVLAYLVAGFAGQRVAVLTVHRAEQAKPLGEFALWLSDMRRMPGVQEYDVRRLTRDFCDAQVLSMLGSDASAQFLEDVYRSSQGNPYLTDLLLTDLRDGRPVPDSLPRELPSALSDALLAAWARLGAPAQQLSRVLAVGGSPAVVADLESVLAGLAGQHFGTGSPTGAPASVMSALHAGIEAGIVIVDGDSVWFRHPLLADVLIATYLPGEAAPVHAEWAAALRAAPSGGGLSLLRRETALARHYEAADQPREAFMARLRAADLAEQQGEVGTTAEHLVHAVDLWGLGSTGPTADPAADPAAPTALVDLLESAARVCFRADRAEDAHRLFKRALPLVGDDPLRASRFTVELSSLEWDLGLVEQPSLTGARAAVELARSDPDSHELAEALVLLVHWLVRHSQHEQAGRTAREAYDVAARSGSRYARSMALGALAVTESDPVRALGFAEEALEEALASGDDRCVTWAYVRLDGLHMRAGRLQEAMPLLDAAYAHAIVNGRGAYESGALADAHLMLGDLRASHDVLRDALARRSRPSTTAWARLTAAALAARRGDLDAARQHRSRALEVMPNLEHRAGASGSGYLAELALTEGDPTSAIRVVLNAIPNVRDDSPYVDELCLWGARAAADLATMAVDRRDKEALDQAHSVFTSLLETRATVAGEPFTARSVDDLLSPAIGALFAAERQRLLACAAQGQDRVDAPEKTAECWRRAAELCARAGMRWDQHHALSQLGVVLVTSAGATSEAKQALRSAHAYAVEQGAVVLGQWVEATAALGRISHSADPARGERPSGFVIGGRRGARPAHGA